MAAPKRQRRPFYLIQVGPLGYPINVSITTPASALKNYSIYGGGFRRNYYCLYNIICCYMATSRVAAIHIMYYLAANDFILVWGLVRPSLVTRNWALCGFS